MHDDGDSEGYFGWFLLGAAVGAAAALLTTPRTGQETREMLSEKGTEWARRAQVFADEAQGRAGEWLDRGRELFEEQTQRLMSAFEAGKDAMREEIGKEAPEPRA
jgi:gas vesicle protein